MSIIDQESIQAVTPVELVVCTCGLMKSAPSHEARHAILMKISASNRPLEERLSLIDEVDPRDYLLLFFSDELRTGLLKRPSPRANAGIPKSYYKLAYRRFKSALTMNTHSYEVSYKSGATVEEMNNIREERSGLLNFFDAIITSPDTPSEILGRVYSEWIVNEKIGISNGGHLRNMILKSLVSNPSTPVPVLQHIISLDGTWLKINKKLPSIWNNPTWNQFISKKYGIPTDLPEDWIIELFVEYYNEKRQIVKPKMF